MEHVLVDVLQDARVVLVPVVVDVKKLVLDAKGHALEGVIPVRERVLVLAHLAVEHAVEVVAGVLDAPLVRGHVKTPVTDALGVHHVLGHVKVLVKILVNLDALLVVNQNVKSLVFQPVLQPA